MSIENRKPDYNICFLDSETSEKGVIGGAWINNDKSISLVLNPMVTITKRKTLMIRLFPATGYVKPNTSDIPVSQGSKIKSMREKINEQTQADLDNEVPF